MIEILVGVLIIYVMLILLSFSNNTISKVIWTPFLIPIFIMIDMYSENRKLYAEGREGRVLSGKVDKLIGKLMFEKLEEEEKKSEIKFVNKCDKNDLIIELEEKLKELPDEYSLNEEGNEEFISLLRKDNYDDMEIISIERMKIIFETSSQHYGNLNNVTLYLTIVLGFISPGIVLIASRFKDLNGQLMVLGISLIFLVFLYIAVILVGLKGLERRHRNLSQVVKYIELIKNTKA